MDGNWTELDPRRTRACLCAAPNWNLSGFLARRFDRDGDGTDKPGQNLLKDRHEEYVDSTGSAATTLIKRSAYAQIRWQF